MVRRITRQLLQRGVGIFDDEFPPSWSSGAARNNVADKSVRALRAPVDRTHRAVDVAAMSLTARILVE
jgi:hypothetical protein